MCGRYTIRSILPVADLFGITLPTEFRPRYNVAPTQDALVVRAEAAGQGGVRRGEMLRWGLVPSWSHDPSTGNRMINARAETAAERPAFRDAMRRRRCLVPADGFYEWQSNPGSRRKQPYLFRMKDDAPFAFAGLWESWSRGDDHIESFAILTTGPNTLVASVHDRMPVIIPRVDYDRWLAPDVPSAGIADLLRAHPPDQMTATPIGLRVNSPSHDDPECIAQA